MIYLTRYSDKPVVEAIQEIIDAGLIPVWRVIDGNICLVGEAK